MRCPSCQTDLPDTAKFCGSCGYQVPAPVAAASSASAPSHASLASSGSLASLDQGRLKSYEELAATPLDVGVGDILREGWELTKPNFGLLLGGMLVVGLMSAAAGVVPFGSVIIGGPLTGGAIAVALRLVAGRPVEFNNFFDGFKRFVPLMLVQLVMSALVVAGTFALILPGLYLAIALSFGTHLVVDRDEEFWPALMGSMKVVNGHFGTFLMFGLAAFGLVLLGTLTCGLGLLVVAPLLMMSSAVLYKRLFGLAGGAERMAG